jgi:FkbM family methyltransferase
MTDTRADQLPAAIKEGENAMSVSLRRRVVNRVVFSTPGLHVFPRLAPFLKRGYNIIMNNDLTPTINGEYWLIGRFPDGGLYVDVGYHQGDWAEEVISQRGGARVLAFDPWPDARTYCDSSPVASQVELFPIALSDQEGTSTFYDYESACNSLARRDLEGSAPSKEYQVQVTTLDVWCQEIGLRYIDLLKIDAEGFDLPVLRGARQLLESQSIGAFVFEYGDAWISSRQFLGEAAAYIGDSGYRLCKLFNGFVAPFDYTIEHETFACAMFVGLSPAIWEKRIIPVRKIKV